MNDQKGQNEHNKLYALILQLRPLTYGTLMPFSGELVHGAWMRWLREAAPEVARRLHEGNQRRLFTCSSLQFPITSAHLVRAQRENIHLPVEPQKKYAIRLTFLLGDLYPLLYTSIIKGLQPAEDGASQPFLSIGKRNFLLESVISSPSDPSGWTGFTDYETLVEQAQGLHLPMIQSLELEFSSLTTFNRMVGNRRFAGDHYASLPLPGYLFPGLARRWQEVAPPALVPMIQREEIEAYIAADGIIIDDYKLHTHQVHFTTHVQRGFIGTCHYQLRGPDDPPSGESTLTIRQQLILLAWFAFYTGIGYKTAMGMGQTRLTMNSGR